MFRQLQALLFYFITASLLSQVDHSSPLFQTLKKQDSLLFEVGFNTCNIDQFKKLVSADFEFYHDQNGITASKAVFIASIEQSICQIPYQPIRILEPSSLEVFALKNNGEVYGAIQKGVHRFYAQEKDKALYFTSIAKFSHVWLLEKDGWKLSRSLSYDHWEEETPIDESLLFVDSHETERWLFQQHISALGIGYIENGVLKESNVYGNLQNGNAAPSEALFNVASLTKPVTAQVALRLINKNLWDLDEPVYTYHLDPDIADDPRAKLVTTRHILSHQTGFPNWRRSLPNGKLAFEFDPGSAYQYSGEGMELLRKALENKFGKSLNELSKELIFDPLLLNNTSHFWEPHIDKTMFVGNYDAEGNAYNLELHYESNAADDLITTVEDYSKFLLSILNHDGLSTELFTEMISEQVITKKDKHFGLGMEVYLLKEGNYALSHGGSDKGVNTLVFLFPKTKKGILIFTNADHGNTIYETIMNHYIPEETKRLMRIETGG